MEGWDGTDDGRPTDLVRRRWATVRIERRRRSCGAAKRSPSVPTGAPTRTSSALGPSSAADLAELRSLLADDQVAGLQLTHSGRWAVDPRPGPQPSRCSTPVATDRGWTDAELEQLGRRLRRGGRARAGRGLRLRGREGVSRLPATRAVGRPGTARGARSLAAHDHRARPCRSPRPATSASGCRCSTSCPHHRGCRRARRARQPTLERRSGSIAADAPQLLELLDVDLVCVTAGSPYYCPHVQRPAYFPPSDGYQPPEDPLVGVARLVDAACALGHARRRT